MVRVRVRLVANPHPHPNPLTLTRLDGDGDGYATFEEMTQLFGFGPPSKDPSPYPMRGPPANPLQLEGD